MEFCMQTLSRISPNRDCYVYSGGDHVQLLHPSAALGPHHLPCSHM